MDVDEDQRVGRQLVAERPEDRFGKVELGRVDEALRRTERIELERLEAFGDHRPRRFEKRLRRALGAVPAIGVAEDAVAHPAAKQLVDRRAQRLAEDVPAGDLDGGDDGPVDVACVERDAVEHPLGEGADAKRVLSDDEVFEFANAGLGGADEAVQRPLADAVQPLVGVDLDEQPVLPAGADGVCLDAGDAHARGSLLPVPGIGNPRQTKTRAPVAPAALPVGHSR